MRHAAKPERIGLFDHVLAFLIPLTAYLKADVGGTIFGQDIAAIVLLPILLYRYGPGRLQHIRILFIMLGVWLAGQMLTDAIRGSAPEDFLRGWSRIIFLGLQAAMLWMLLSRRWSLFVTYMAGVGIESIIAARHLDFPMSEYPWKFGIGLGIVILASVAGSMLGRRGRFLSLWGSPFLLTVAGALALYKGSRSVFGSALMAAMFLFIADYIASRPRTSRLITPRMFTVFVLGGFVAAQLLLSVYGTLAESGSLGRDAREKYELQSAGDTNLLQGGRIETLVSIQAIKDSPIIGHGSWAHDMTYVRMLARRTAELGLKDTEGTEGKSDLIPSHSHLFGAWVEAGITGAIFWMWALWLCLVALYRLLKDRQIPSPVVVVAVFTMMWDVPFSPMGAEVRFIRAADFALLMYIIRSAEVAKHRLQIKRRMKMAHESFLGPAVV
jgi:hypothetical protein